MTCQACAAELRPGARFCDACGAPQATGCPTCGAEPRPGARFCDTCGTPLAAVAAPPPAAPPAAAPAGELRTVSVLFVDLVGYTALSETRDAEDVRALLSRYFDTARTVVGRHGGTVEKFIGDAVMAVWGTPVAQEDDGERAVRAGLELVEAVTAFGTEVGAPALRARAGIVTGQAAAVRSPDEGIVVGDRVNTAARVQSVAAPGTLLVDEVTRSVAAAAVAFEDGGEHVVKGKAEPLRLWRAVRVVGGVGGNQREEGLSAPFVGREGDLRLLKDLFHQAQERRGVRLVTVTGAAGVGKSRLLTEFGHYVDGLHDSVLWHEGRCLAYGDGVAYWALAQMVRTRLGIEEDGPTELAATRLAAGLERWVPDPAERAHVLPRLGALLGTADPGLAREDLFSGWRLFLERLAVAEPVVLAFEDLQWADPGLLDFITHLLEWAAPVPIFVVALARPELAERAPGWPPPRAGTTALHLEPLTAGDVATVLEELVADLPVTVTEQIVDRAEGVPLYALETVRALVDDGTLAARDGRLHVARDVGELRVPPTLTALLTARLDGLPAEERDLVRVVSVLGGSFPRGAAAALSALPADRLDATLGALVRKQVLLVRADPLSPERGQYAFAQGLLRTVAYDLLTKRERAPLHLAAAEHLRSAFPDEGDEVAEVIAAHELDALQALPPAEADALRPRVIAALRRAAARSLGVGAPEAAERALRTAAGLVPAGAEHLELLEAAADAAHRAGRFAVAVELRQAIHDAYLAAGDARAAARAVAPLARSMQRGGDNAGSLPLLREALDVLADEAPDEAVADLHANVAGALIYTGDSEAATPHLERARELGAALDLPEILFDGLNLAAMQLTNAGRYREALVLYVGMVDLAERVGDARMLSIAGGNAGDVLLRAGLPGAIDHLEAGVDRGRAQGSAYLVDIGLASVALAHYEAGRWDDVVAITPPAGSEGWAVMWPVVVRALRGDAAGARDLLATAPALRHSDDVDVQGLVGLADAVIADVAGTQGGGVVRAAVASHERGGTADDGFRAGWPLALAAAMREGDLAAAETLVGLLESQPDGLLNAGLVVHRRRGRALLDAAAGRHEGVEATLREAVGRLDALERAPDAAAVRTDLAAWLLDQGRPDDAGPLLREARATFAGIGAVHALARLDALEARQPVAPG